MGGGSENQLVSGVTTICLMQCNTSPSHRVDQVVDCGLWNVGPLLFNGCAKLLDIGRNWNTLSYTPIQSIPNMLNGWHVRWVCWPCKNWDVFSFQELCTDPCNMGPCIIMLQHEVMVVDEWHNNGPQDLVTVRPVGCTAKFSETPLETAYGREMNIQFTGNSSGGHSCSQHANCNAPSKLATSVALCCVIKLHILEWPFIVASLRRTCAIIMLSNQHLDMPHLWGGWIISAKEQCSLTQI